MSLGFKVAGVFRLTPKSLIANLTFMRITSFTVSFVFFMLANLRSPARDTSASKPPMFANTNPSARDTSASNPPMFANTSPSAVLTLVSLSSMLANLRSPAGFTTAPLSTVFANTNPSTRDTVSSNSPMFANTSPSTRDTFASPHSMFAFSPDFIPTIKPVLYSVEFFDVKIFSHSQLVGVDILQNFYGANSKVLNTQ
jgi:hypothetical protein